jgi:Family of unknown function (DUF5681)
MSTRGGKRSTSFKPGQSGNPSGRARVPAEVKEMARAYTEEAIKTLATVMNDKKAPASARVMAANAIIDRAYGKPTQHIEAHVDLIDRLSLTEQEALASALATLAGDQDDPADGSSETQH